MNPTKYWCTFALALVMSVALLSITEAAPMPSHNNGIGYLNGELDEPTEEVLMDLIARFGQTIMRARDDLENSKRTVDFGLARGYSGLQEAKHRMGLAAANYAGGPGRKRRSNNMNSEE